MRELGIGLIIGGVWLLIAILIKTIIPTITSEEVTGGIILLACAIGTGYLIWRDDSHQI